MDRESEMTRCRKMNLFQRKLMTKREKKQEQKQKTYLIKEIGMGFGRERKLRWMKRDEDTNTRVKKMI